MGKGTLKDRTGVILSQIVGEYIVTATPVPSQALVGKSGLRVSPATVRNDMAALEERGYIHRPHISAGAVPSDKGYRFYVDALEEEPDLPPDVAARVNAEFRTAAPDVEGWTRLAARALSELVGNVAIITLPRSKACRVKRIELVYLQDFMTLLVVVLEEAQLRQRIVPVAEHLTQDDLVRTANKLNYLFGGLHFQEIAAKQSELTPTEDKLKQNAVSILKEAEAEALEPWVDGVRYLLRQPEFASGEVASAAAELLEQKDTLRKVLATVVDGETPLVVIGEENEEASLRAFSLVLYRYGEPGGAGGVIGILGPTRLQYRLALAGVRYMSSFIGGLVASVQGRSF